MPRQRTTPILVLAILHLVGGGLGLFFSLCGCGGLVMSNALSSVTPTFPTRPGQPPPPPNAAQIMQYYDDHVPGYRAFTIGNIALSLLLDLLLIAGGIGLLKMQPWARWLSLVYAPLSILYHLASFLYSLILVMPATDKLYAQNPALAAMSSFITFASGIGVFFALLIVIYPIAVIVILLLPSTSAAFRGEMPVDLDNLGAEEPDEDEPKHEPPSDKFRRG